MRADSLFVVSGEFLLFDYLRVPHERAVPEEAVGPLAWVRPAGDPSRGLCWVPSSAPLPGRVDGAYRLGQAWIFGGVLADSAAELLLGRIGGRWHRATPIVGAGGERVASLWRSRDGSVFLPFDPNEAIRRFWTETYAAYLGSPSARRARTLANRGYYRLRPLVPSGARIALRRRFSAVQSRTSFPRWPIETALHDLCEMLLAIACELAGEPVPMISLWPAGHQWALVLTHDVETRGGYTRIDLLRDIEMRAGYRSSWNFVPSDDPVLERLVAELDADGFEVGVHGLHHDGRDIAELATRLPQIRRYGERWSAAGFRSPATLRDWNSMQLLPFDYDSSYFDTSPFEPQPGGCASWLPYMIGDLVELPITLVQDHTLFEILRQPDGRLWLEKAHALRDRGGMALVLTHPDYAGNDRLVSAYDELLDSFKSDETAWKALPRAVSAWWRQRAATELRMAGGGWELVGPAAREGSVSYIELAAAEPRWAATLQPS